MAATTDRGGGIPPGYSKPPPLIAGEAVTAIIQFVRLAPNSPHRGVGRACGVGRDLGIALGVAVGVAVGVGVGVAVGVGVGVAVGVGVGVGVPLPPGAWISTFIGEPV